jgi:hypothetical protein
MRPILVIAYVQHGQKGTGYDPGAWADIDGDGIKETWEQEARLAAGYASLIAGVANKFGAEGHPVSGLMVGWGDEIDALQYDAGHARVNAIAADWHARNPGGVSVALACHCNAGGGTYGVVAWDERSGLGRDCAANIATAWKHGIPAASAVKRWVAKSDGQRFERHMHYTVRGGYAGPARHCSVLLEPGFLDTPAHRAMWTPQGLDQIARATVAGLLTWADQ